MLQRDREEERGRVGGGERERWGEGKEGEMEGQSHSFNLIWQLTHKESCDSHVMHHLDNAQPCPLPQPFNVLHSDVAKSLVGLAHKLSDSHRRNADLHKLQRKLDIILTLRGTTTWLIETAGVFCIGYTLR